MQVSNNGPHHSSIPQQNDSYEQTEDNERDQYRLYAQKKRLDEKKAKNQYSGNKKNVYVIVVSAIFLVLLASAIFYVFKSNYSKSTSRFPPFTPDISPHSHIYTRHDHQIGAAPMRSPATPQLSGTCNSYLPYSLSSLKTLQQTYYQWYGKVGSYIGGRSYDTGHFIERHVAVNGQCTSLQSSQGKSVFYDWNEVTKAFKSTQSQKCPLNDRTTFSYDFQFKIASPSDYIKGIDCRSGTIKNYSRVFILYRRAIKSANPYQNQYLASDHATIWTFYPKS